MYKKEGGRGVRCKCLGVGMYWYLISSSQLSSPLNINGAIVCSRGAKRNEYPTNRKEVEVYLSLVTGVLQQVMSAGCSDVFD